MDVTPVVMSRIQKLPLIFFGKLTSIILRDLPDHTKYFINIHRLHKKVLFQRRRDRIICKKTTKRHEKQFSEIWQTAVHKLLHENYHVTITAPVDDTNPEDITSNRSGLCGLQLQLSPHLTFQPLFKTILRRTWLKLQVCHIQCIPQSYI